jgi:hypothetical protein
MPRKTLMNTNKMFANLNNNQPPNAVVIGLDSVTGLQTARILSKHNVPVIGIAKDRGHYCCKTLQAILEATQG